MTVYVFGNPDLPQDALPLRLLPRLRTQFRDLTFEVKDPNEEWAVPKRLVVIDTVVGLDRVRTFHSLEPFAQAPRVSLHDFDALSQLRFLQKLGQLDQVTVIGVPPTVSETEALAEVAATLATLVSDA